MKKKILLGSLFFIILVGGLLVSVAFMDTSQFHIALQEESIIVSINPKVMYKTSNTGSVIEVIHLNDDAKIYNEDDFLGLDIKEAVNKTVEVARANGYVKEDTVINVSSLSEDSVYVEDIVLNLKGNKINVKTEKLSKDAIETIMSNIDTTGEVETEFTVLDDYVVIKKHSDIKGPGPSKEETQPENRDEEPVTEKDLGSGYVKVEQAGYGDYIKGDHVYLYEGGPRYYKFYETSKVGCKDAIDKKACARAWIDDLTPRLATVRGNLETWQNHLDEIGKREIEAQQKITELEDDLVAKNFMYYGSDDIAGEKNLKEYIQHYKSVYEGCQSEKKEAQDYIKAIGLEIEEYNKVLAVYYAVLNN